MSNYCLPQNEPDQHGQLHYLTLAKIRQIKNIYNSDGLALHLYKTQIVNGVYNKLFMGLLNGSRIGEALASLVDEKTVSELPFAYDAHAHEGHPKYELFSCSPYKENRVIYELFTGDIENISSHEYKYFANQEELYAEYHKICQVEIPKTAYMLKHYFTNKDALVSVSEYTPLV